MTVKNEIKIRLGKLDDIHKIGEIFSDSVCELCKNDYDEHTIDRWVASISPEFRTKYINIDALWVAEIDNEITGYLISIPGEIIALFVGSSYAGLGVGSALVKLGINVARKIGARKIKEIKLESTITAVSFYKKMGFKEISRGYYTYEQTDLKLPIVNMTLL